MTVFGDRMEALRKDRGLSYRALGAAVGMSHGNVAKILTGRHGATEEPGHQRNRPPTPPLGADLQLWFDVLGTKSEDEPLLRVLAAAAHVPDETARSELERLLLSVKIPADPTLPSPSDEAVTRRAASGRSRYRIGETQDVDASR